MKQTRLLMGMPITIEVIDPQITGSLFNRVYEYFQSIDDRFSTYKSHSEISLLNQHKLAPGGISPEMQTVFALAEDVRQKTNGYFDIHHNGITDPSGLVKGWAVYNAAEFIRKEGFRNFYVEAGGDFQVYGRNDQGQYWRVGIRSPFNLNEIVKVLAVTDCGVATSGSYIRGRHIYNPKGSRPLDPEIVSLTVIGPDIYNVDCYATAAFAMGREGIAFIASLDGYEGYMIDQDRRATFTPGFTRYVTHA
jgi:thiamine biosynthesis lipoprotein